MPLYEYKCESCAAVFEIIQRFADAPLTVHEGCGGAVERLLSAPSLQFKGTGWYVTDYARGGSNGPSESKAEAKSESKGEAKGESKGEVKSESKDSSGKKDAVAPAAASTAGKTEQKK